MAKKWIQELYEVFEPEFELNIDELIEKIKKIKTDTFLPFMLKAIILMKKN
ncbi:hypothetical protein KKG72_06540 [bacterium]|nr:hypothetical protein [bacterium]MBU1994871.1 hypothetical protein [bacterium]